MNKYSREIRNLQYHIQYHTANVRAIDRVIDEGEEEIRRPFRLTDGIIERTEFPAIAEILKILSQIEQEAIEEQRFRTFN